MILAKAELTLIVEYTEKQFIADEPHHLNPVEWYARGLYGWLLEDIQKINPPINYKGKQGLFEVEYNAP